MKSSNSVSSLRRDLIEWICHIMIYSCDSENRMEIAVSIFDVRSLPFDGVMNSSF